MKLRVGDNGTPARYGGEEFVIVLPGLSLDEATALANAIRESVAMRSMKRKSTGERLGKITVSFGIAQLRKGDSKSHILERADNALYLAKNSGRNCVKTERDLETVHKESATPRSA